MSEISQIGAFDTEIIETSRRIERLVQERAPYTQIEDEQFKLSSLMNQKRRGLYQAKDPSYYVDQFFQCTSADDRRKKAAKFAEGALASINAILESDDRIADPVQLETFVSVVEFFRFSSGKDAFSVSDTDDTSALTVPELPEVFFEQNYLSKIKLGQLSTALMDNDYFTEENGRYFVNRLSSGRHKTAQDVPLLVEWKYDVHALATMLTLATELGIVNNLGTKKNPKSADSVDEPDSRATVAAAILRNFSITLSRPLSDDALIKLIYRHTKEAKDSVETFFSAVEDARRAHSVNKDNRDYKPLETTEGVIREFYRVQKFLGVAEGIRNQCPHMDFNIVDIFYDLIVASEDE
jgi:hypothetical protein